MPEEKVKAVEKAEKTKTIEELLMENLELSKKIFESSEKVRKYLMWSRIWGITKLALIIIPLIIFAIVVVPMLQNVLNQYSGALNQINDLQKGGLQGIDAQTIQDLLKR